MCNIYFVQQKIFRNNIKIYSNIYWTILNPNPETVVPQGFEGVQDLKKDIELLAEILNQILNRVQKDLQDVILIW